MNIVLILVDSLNKRYLRTYNPDAECDTRNIEALAQKSFVFDNHFVGSLPCMPARRDLFAGRKDFLWRPWGPLEVFDPRLPRLLQAVGYGTGMVTDHYHYWEEQANGYMQAFQSTVFIRGHETDYWQLPAQGSLPKWAEKACEFRNPEHIRQYYGNVKDFKGEEDYFSAKVFSSAADWLDRNAQSGPFFLQVEAFDVHEPFDVPEPYESMYSGGRSKDDYNIWPPYQVYGDRDAFMDQTTKEELEFLRSQYAGKVTMADRWLGKLLRKFDELALWDDTMVIFTTDHGHDLAERRAFGKQYPHYDSHANIPLIVWHPRWRGDGRRVGALTQTVDLFATILEEAGAPVPESNRHSRSAASLFEDPTASLRDVVSYGTFGQGLCVTDGDWSLFCSPVEGEPLYTYSTMVARPLLVDNPVDGRVGSLPRLPVDQGNFDPTVEYPLWKTPITIQPRTTTNYLFHRAEDPDQEHNLWDSDTGERERMRGLASDLIEDEGYPSEQRQRLGLN